MIAKGLSRLIEEHAIREYPRESCGLVIDGTIRGRDIDGDYLPLENLHPDPTKSFRIDRKIWLELGSRVTAVVHSHPDGPDCPSEADMRSQMATRLPYIIVSTNGVNCTTPFEFGVDLEPHPLVGRGFRHGVTDCFAAIRDWYRLNTEVVLEDFARDWLWWKKGSNFYVENYSAMGFRLLNENEEPKRGDAFFVCVGSKVPNHGGIYVGNGKIYHHLAPARGGPYAPSYLAVEEYGLRWQSYRPVFGRHRDLEN